MAAGAPPAQAFFADGGAGARFFLYHPCAQPARRALVYVHPFAEEMNRSRHVAARLGRALAAEATALLQVDLHGCGDSAGDFADARWDGWLADLDHACALLAERSGVRPGLVGVRLGALLALDYASKAAHKPAQLLLWQPVLQGATYLTQFLRLRSASGMLAGGATENTAALRARLAEEGSLEVAGYTLAQPLAAAIDALDARTLAPLDADWFDLRAAERPLAPASATVAEAWRAAGCRLRLHQVDAPAFWATPEPADAGALVDATAALVRVDD